jgi:hypothetical protein
MLGIEEDWSGFSKNGQGSKVIGTGFIWKAEAVGEV